MSERVDIKLVWDNDLGECDLSLLRSDLRTDDGLETATLISLFTDRRARNDQELPDSEAADRRGWWGDLTSSIENDEIGSWLWLLERSKTTQQTLEQARIYAEQALQWMITDGVASAIDVEVEGRETDITEQTLAIHVKIWRNDGTLVEVEAL